MQALLIELFHIFVAIDVDVIPSQEDRWIWAYERIAVSDRQSPRSTCWAAILIAQVIRASMMSEGGANNSSTHKR